MTQPDDNVRQVILEQIAVAKRVAPRDVAQVLAGDGEDWRRYLPRIRAEATRLYHEEKLLFIRKKKSVSPEGLKGVFRLAAPDQDAEA